MTRNLHPLARLLPFAAAAALAAAPRAAQAQSTPQDFGAQAKLIHRIVLCSGSDALPDRVDAKVHAKHCKELTAAIAEYRKEWLDKAMPFIAKVRPASLPTRVFYPYGGGDLVTALAVFPDATEFTTISLESVGDPRGIDTLAGAALDKALGTNRHNVVRLMKAAFSATTELAAGESSDLPGQLVLSLGGLVVHGYEPVALRYFTFAKDGSLVYVTADQIAAYDKTKKKLGKKAERELRQHLFSNAELTFRKAGDPKAPLKTYRHIAANLYDQYLPKDAPLVLYLKSMGRFAAMTKAASHLLWAKQSSTMRALLLGQMDWMISDATGIPPADAKAAGFVQVTWGKYVGAYFEHRAPGVEKTFVELWKANPQQDLPFRFGYFDKSFNSHMLVTRKP